jgi:hypothetical protein
MFVGAQMGLVLKGLFGLLLAGVVWPRQQFQASDSGCVRLTVLPGSAGTKQASRMFARSQ